MSQEPYARGLVPERPFVAVEEIEGEFVAVLGVSFPNRDLALEPYGSRAFPDGSIAEVCVTDESAAAPGKRVARAAYLGFVRFARGGVIAVGMECQMEGGIVGAVVGFDGAHAPNHWNIVVRGSRFANGAERGIHLNERIRFVYQSYAESSLG